MSYFKDIRSWLILSAICVSLSGCQTLSTAELSAQTQSEINRIDIAPADSRLQQIFNRKLSDNLNQTSALRDLALSTTLTASNSETLSVHGKSSNLSKTVMTLSYQLTDKLSGTEITSGEISATATSGTVSSYFGQDKSKRFAAERLTSLLADRLSLRLRRFFIETDKAGGA